MGTLCASEYGPFGIVPCGDHDWNRNNPSRKIRDVILTGGAPLSLGDDALAEIISEFRAIEGVELWLGNDFYPDPR